jgi:glycosyltransferase involved in cell wall biosynthesis
MSKKLISIVTPVFNEEEAIEYYYRRISNTIDSLSDRYNFEIVVTDNCSTDNSFQILQKLAQKDSRISVYKFSRNFGYQKSIWTGYSKCKGRAAIEFDVDLQDPPEMLPEMLDYWEKGYKIVYGVRKGRKEGKLINFARKIFYRLVRYMSEVDIPNDAGDFMLIDRDIINHLCQIKSQDPYLRGTIFSLGYLRKGIEYNRNERVCGSSKFPLKRLIKLAVDGIVNTSVFPLRIATLIGLFSGFCATLLASYFVMSKLLGADLPRGVTAILVLLLSAIAINSILIGIIGEYIGRIYKQISSGHYVTIVEKEIKNIDRQVDKE